MTNLRNAATSLAGVAVSIGITKAFIARKRFKNLRREADVLTELVAKQALELRLLKEA